MDLGLRDRVYVVTGGSRGLGLASARALVGDGARVVLSSRDPDRIAEVAAELGAPDRVVGVVADNGEPATGDLLVGTARDRFGRIDGALISVGGPPAGSVLDTDDEAWRRSFETVFLGALRIARAVGHALSAGGSIAFVLSSSVRSPIPGLGISNGLRPGLAMAAKTLADELGPAGVRVNGLLPGRVDTDRVRELDAAAGDPAGARERFSRAIPLGRYGEPAELGRVAAFLLSPAASYVTGVMLPIDGGALRAL